ncbi:carboxymuconolactone decarboxylase family protein [Enterococcus sp. LJL90]
MDKYASGLKAREEIIGQAASEMVTQTLKDISPVMDDYIKLTFGQMKADETLDLKQRELIVLTTLLTQGDTAPQLKIHLQGALNVGLSKAEIIETFVQCLPYVGFPKVMNALTVAKDFFAEKAD